MKTIKKVTLVQESISSRRPRSRRMNEERTTGAERSLENSWLKDFRSTGFHKVRLTKDEEYELLRAFLEDGDKEAYNTLMKANAMLAYTIARKYCRNREDMPDYTSEAMLGLDAAIKHYNLDKGMRLSTIAYPWITKYVREYMYGTDSGVVVKPHAQQIGKNIREQRARFFAKNGRYPETDELKQLLWDARKLRVPDDELHDLIVNSTNATVAGDDEEGASEYGETGSFALRTSSRNDYEQQLDDEEIADKVDTLLMNVDATTRKVLQMKFGLAPYDCEHEDADIADELGVSPMTVRNIYTRAYKKLAAMR